MLKPLLFALVLLAMGLVAAAVFLPQRGASKVPVSADDAAKAKRFNRVWLAGTFVVLALLALVPFALGSTHSGDAFGDLVNLVLGIYWWAALAVAGAVMLAFWYASQFFRSAFPLAQEFGATLTEAERRSLWRRSLRVFQRFQRWHAAR